MKADGHRRLVLGHAADSRGVVWEEAEGMVRRSEALVPPARQREKKIGSGREHL